MQNISIKLKFILILLTIFCSFSAYSGDDLIFKNSFEPPEVFELTFINPDENQVFEDEVINVRVKATQSSGTLESVTINDIQATVVDQNNQFAEFEALIPLSLGDNTLEAIANYTDESISALRQVRYVPLNKVTITSPIDWQTLGRVEGSGDSTNQTGTVQRPVTIIGTLSSNNITEVKINQQQAEVNSITFSFTDFFLHEGSNLINVVATDEYDRQSNAQITVYVDQSAPLITTTVIDGLITSNNSLDISGFVNDAMGADFNATSTSVVINNPAKSASIQAQVYGTNYLAQNIPLAVGNNTLFITATDGLANSREITTNVVRIAVGTDRITRFSGNNQSHFTNTQLDEPLTIVAMDKAGLPLVDLPIYFDINKGDATISETQNQASLSDGVTPARNLIINTDTTGQAQVWLKLGSQAGLANNIIRASTQSTIEDVYFYANTLSNDPAKVLIEGASGTQYAQTNSQPVEALTAMVLDENNNPVTNTSVVFTITQGDGIFDTQSAPDAEILNNGQSIRTFTDNKGQASSRPRLGSQAGHVKIIATAELENNTTIGQATFNIIVLKRSDAATRFSGTVMDHSGVPIQGIQFSIARTNLTTLSDENGYFTFPNSVPTGKIDLFVDGRNVQVQQNGETIEYPALHFETAIIQGQNNQLPHIIYLPPVHIENTMTVGGNEDVTLTIPGFQGFKMIVKANSVTFPDGSTEGELVVNPVHNDRLPMVPPGTGGRFMATGWTLQPTGTRFDPPIEVHIPNTDGLKPGTTVPIVQWDHDMAYFVPMGQGTISEDGSTLVSNSGSGITKAGWGGGPPTPPPVDEANEGCQMYITANGEAEKLWELETKDGIDVNFKAHFTGNSCGDWKYDWEMLGGTMSETSSDPSPTQHYEDVREYIVSLEVTCTDCTPSRLEDKIDIEIFVPVVEIKEDEEEPFELISAGIFNLDYFLERTNLIIEVQYPQDHPEAGEVITDYSGEAKITEEKSTTYYDDENGASELPEDIDIDEGIGKISLDSVSDEIANSEGPNGWPKDAKIEVDIEEFDYLDADSTKSIDVEQWVTDSDLEVSDNAFTTNDPNTPDWLERQAWNLVRTYRGNNSEIVREVVYGVDNVFLANPSDIVEGAECGNVAASATDSIWIGVTCHIEVGDDINSHRRNTDKWLTKTMLFQARETWQNAQLLLEPANATGDVPKQDSDGDGCPEVVLNEGTEAGPNDDTSIQDGTPPTTGDDGENSADNGPYSVSPYPWNSTTVTKCEYIRKKDAVQFMYDHE